MPRNIAIALEETSLTFEGRGGVQIRGVPTFLRLFHMGKLQLRQNLRPAFEGQWRFTKKVVANIPETIE